MWLNTEFLNIKIIISLNPPVPTLGGAEVGEVTWSLISVGAAITAPVLADRGTLPPV